MSLPEKWLDATNMQQLRRNHSFITSFSKKCKAVYCLLQCAADWFFACDIKLSHESIFSIPGVTKGKQNGLG